MARDRQRAKQRRARRRETVPPAERQGARPTDDRRTARTDAERPGAGPLDHGSAGADEAAARLALGAEAAALPTGADERSGLEPAATEDGPDDRTAPTAEVDDRALAEAAVGRRADGRQASDPDGLETAGAATPARRPEASRPAPLRAVGFLRNCWAELRRVQWPDRRQVGQATGVVLLFVIIAGAYLGLADAVAQKIVDTIL